ncbi:hypothetical protein G6F42_023655 [Rhizopus arrhizus]|nr:hypothetical protein G6F42_023655 [Rhizopus arrhizus]
MAHNESFDCIQTKEIGDEPKHNQTRIIAGRCLDFKPLEELAEDCGDGDDDGVDNGNEHKESKDPKTLSFKKIKAVSVSINDACSANRG